MTLRMGDCGGGTLEEWSLTAHSPGQERWVPGVEELLRLNYEAIDDDVLAGELTLTHS